MQAFYFLPQRFKIWIETDCIITRKLVFISPYSTEILDVVTEKVTAKALWEVIGTSQNQFTYLLVLKDATAREVHSRIKQGHITLYLAFFQKWNKEYFKNTLTVNRTSIMERAKIKSKTTYNYYLKDLNDWAYLDYFLSFHPARGSKVRMAIFGTTSGTAAYQKLASSVPEPDQNMVPSYKHKTKENFNKLAKPKNELVVLNFFKENNWPEMEHRKFYAYYYARNWKLQRGLNIRNWKERAKKFVEKGCEIKQEAARPISGYLKNLKSMMDKNYDEPL